MVFGRRAVAEAPKLPAPPSVDQILEDLEQTSARDPVFSMSSDLLKNWLEVPGSGNNSDSDPAQCYDKVMEYVNKKETLEQLEKKINQGSESLNNSLGDLKQIASSVAVSLETTTNS